MPYQFTAKEVSQLNNLTFTVEAGVVTGLHCQVEANYGTMSLTHDIDLWAELTGAQKLTTQNLYSVIKTKVTQLIVGVPA